MHFRLRPKRRGLLEPDGRRDGAIADQELLGSQLRRLSRPLLLQLRQQPLQHDDQPLLAAGPCDGRAGGRLPAHRGQAILEAVPPVVGRRAPVQLRRKDESQRPVVECLRRRHGVDGAGANPPVRSDGRHQVHRQGAADVRRLDLAHVGTGGRSPLVWRHHLEDGRGEKQECLLQRACRADCRPPLPLLRPGQVQGRQAEGRLPERGGQNLHLGEEQPVRPENGRRL